MSYTLDEWDQDEDFDRWYSDATGARIRVRLDEMLARTVLEIGCATGRMTAQLAEVGAPFHPLRRILAMDLDEGMLLRAQERDLVGVEWVHGNVLDLALAASLVLQRALRPFEAIVCCSVLHEVESPSQILWRAHELLAPRGVVFVTVPSAGSVHLDGRPSTRASRFGVRRLWSLDQWAEALQVGSGLRVVYAGEMMLKPWPNERMETLDPHVLDYLARYRGPGGAICFFELEAA